VRSIVRIAVLAVGGLLVAGCAGQSTIYNNMISGGWYPYVYGYAAGRRDLTTVIVGNPFDIDQAELDTRLTAMLSESPTFLQPTHFTTTPGPSARPEYRAVVLLNRQIVLPGLACRAPEQVPAADLGATTRLMAVFCQQGGYLSTVTGELQGVTGIDDPRFSQLIGQMVPLLFPPIDPTRDDNNMLFLIRAGACGVTGAIPNSAADCHPTSTGDHLAVDVRAQRLGRAAGAHRSGREAP
jgi:hypothetical protein